jgi:hypothetical protein
MEILFKKISKQQEVQFPVSKTDNKTLNVDSKNVGLDKALGIKVKF